MHFAADAMNGFSRWFGHNTNGKARKRNSVPSRVVVSARAVDRDHAASFPLEFSMKSTHLLLVAVLAVAPLATGPASALPLSSTSHGVTASSASSVQMIDYRRGYAGRRGSGGRNVGLGIAAAIIGGVVISQAARANNYSGGYYERRYRASGSSAAQHCADTYRSFDWDSGTYMGYDGERHVCPYLR
jgi:hypothetical protein